MKATLLIFLLASFRFLAYAQIAGAVNEAPRPAPTDGDFNEDENAQEEPPLDQSTGFIVPTIDNTGAGRTN